MKAKGTETTGKPAYLTSTEERLLAARIANSRAQDRYDEETVAPKRAALVGRCYAYPNNHYSCAKAGEYWTTYAMIVRLEDTLAYALEVQTDSNNQTTVQEKHFGLTQDAEPMSGWEPCENDRFVGALMSALAKLEGLYARAKAIRGGLVPLGRPRRGKKAK